VVALKGNPLSDPRVRRFVEDDRPSMVKDLLAHLKKHGGPSSGGGGKKGGKGKKKGKGKAQDEDDDDGHGEAEGGDDLAALLAQMAGGLLGHDSAVATVHILTR